MINSEIGPDLSSIPQGFGSSVTRVADPASSLAVRRLTESPSGSEKASGILGLSVKILRAPILFLGCLIFKPFSMAASYLGLGNESETRHVDQEKRAQLLALGGEEIRFGLHKKAVLEGMFFQANHPTPSVKTILICTGSHLSYEKYAIPMVEALKSLGHHVMVFNYEGFGNSEGERSEAGIYRSVEGAYQYLLQEKRCSDENIVGWGYSLGSGAVSDMASKHRVDVVIDRGFSSMSEVAYQAAPRGLKTAAKIIFLLGARFDNVSKLKKAHGHMLIGLGMGDVLMQESGKILQDALSTQQHVVFMKVDSAHQHNEQVWFGTGKDRVVVEQFLGCCPGAHDSFGLRSGTR